MPPAIHEPLHPGGAAESLTTSNTSRVSGLSPACPVDATGMMSVQFEMDGRRRRWQKFLMNLKRALALCTPGLLLLLTCLRPAGAANWSALPADDGSATVAPLPVAVEAGDPLVAYSGRFAADKSGMLSGWPACAATVRFMGTAVNGSFGLGANRLEVIVDGVPTKILLAAANARTPLDAPPATLYSLAADLPPGEHTITVFKCTEPHLGNASFAGFQLSAGATLLPVPPAPHKLVVIGDSISCGYGNEAANQNEHFTPGTENAYWTYGAIAARELKADYTCVAWSGRKMYPNFTIPEIYDRTLPRDPASHWEGDKRKPDAILINLCTNDMGTKELPARADWVKAYRDFIARLRRDAPEAMIYCALGSMLGDNYPPGRTSLTTAREWIKEVVNETNAAGDAKVRFLEFAPQNRLENGIGADWHPSVKTHEVMADKLVDTLRADLHW